MPLIQRDELLSTYIWAGENAVSEQTLQHGGDKLVTAVDELEVQRKFLVSPSELDLTSGRAPTQTQTG